MKRYLLILLCFTLLGCASYRDAMALRAGYTRLDRAEKELAAVKAEGEAKVKAATTEVEKTKDGLYRQAIANFQSQSNAFYKVWLAEDTNPNRNRRDTIIYLTSETGLKVGLPPTVDAILAANESLKRELDETLTSNADLLAQHEKDIAAAEVQSQALKDKEAAVVAAQAEKARIENEAHAKIAEKETARFAASTKVLALEHQRGDDADARHAMLTKLSLYCGLGAMAALAACIWLPVYKVQSGLLAALLGFAAVGIWYIDGTVVLIATLVALAMLGAWLVYRHWVLDKSHTALVNTNNDIQVAHPDVFASIVAPALAENATVYKKDAAGNVITVPDKSVTAQIDKTLMASDRK